MTSVGGEGDQFSSRLEVLVTPSVSSSTLSVPPGVTGAPVVSDGHLY